ncbi:MAG: glycolate oxidase subunit GlcF [Alphaproteobacteria bacterium]|nr:glycolate oxidase subunit GlcF [Alphaproteobacteria bacterium]
MQTNFTLAQLADPDVAEANKILRTCVHCGFCTATCPTYVLLGDELDSPRGRIYLIKDVLENDKPANEQFVKHIDRCLSCLSCMSTCPSGVHYMHLVDHARAHIENTYQRPYWDRTYRRLLSILVPRPWLFRLALLGAWFARPFAGLMPAGRLRAMFELAPRTLPGRSAWDRVGTFPADGKYRDRPRRRVALMAGCAQRVLDPEINDATIRLLNRHGCEVSIVRGVGCCGAVVHHMGKTEPSHAQAAANVRAWMSRTLRRGGPGLDAIIINTSGCGTTVKDYGYMLREDPELAEDAAHISSITRDVTEFMTEMGLAVPRLQPDLTVAYHSACSMQHGQQIKTQPVTLLRQAGFEVRQPNEGHLCCGSAGTYNLLQPEIATALRDRKVSNLEATAPDLIATGNIGCMTQIAGGTEVPVLHTAMLLDWVTGGPQPKALPDALAARAVPRSPAAISSALAAE